jgi:hypothetical protein
MYGSMVTGIREAAVIIGEKAIGEDRQRGFGYQEIGNLEIMVITGGVDTGEDN